MCYNAMIAAAARTIEHRWGIDYEEALKYLISVEKTKRWTGVFEQAKVPILLANGKVEMARWTFLAPWIKDELQASKQPGSTGNCVSEEMFSKATWKDAAREGRCLIPVECYYEFQHRGSVTVPFRFFRPNNEIFFFGGVAQIWPVTGEWTFAVCTMAPNKLAKWIHNNPKAFNGPRQPVMPRLDDEKDRWLGGGGPETIQDIIQVREDDFLVAQITANSKGTYKAKYPAEPPGRPENVVDPEPAEHFE